MNQSYLINQYKFKKLQEHTFVEQPLVLVSSNEATNLNSDAVNLSTKVRTYGNLYEGLVRFDHNNNIKPCLALSW